jgi:hypothetical protein
MKCWALSPDFAREMFRHLAILTVAESQLKITIKVSRLKKQQLSACYSLGPHGADGNIVPVKG